jgi:hypothetical protein
VLLEAGIVGMRVHLARHEPVRVPPPFDEAYVLEPSWRALCRPLQELFMLVEGVMGAREQALAARDSMRVLQSAISDLGRSQQQTAAAWLLYRRVLAAYAHQRALVEPQGGLGTGGGGSGAGPKESTFMANLKSMARPAAMSAVSSTAVPATPSAIGLPLIALPEAAEH